MQLVVKNKNWRWNKACHLLSDAEEELHEFAQKIGLKRKWFQKNVRLDHYDLTESKRREAVLAGATEINFRDVVNLIKKRRSKA